MAKVRFSQGLNIIGEFEPVYQNLEEDPVEEEQPLAAENAPEHTAGSLISDTGIDIAKGVIGVPEFITGLYDIPTGGRAGQLVEDAGIRFEDAAEYLESHRSEAGKANKQAVEEAEGFVDTAKEALSRPSTILSTVAESAPSMLGGGAIAKGIVKAAPKVAPVIAGALGEGAVGAGSMAEQTRQQSEDGTLSTKQTGLSVASGLATALLGAGGGKIAKWLGVADPETLLAGEGVKAASKNLVKRMAAGGLTESVFEELPQSAQEQALNNLANDRPWHEGVADAGAVGALAGGVMGGGAQVIPGAAPAQPTPQDPERAELARAINETLNTANLADLDDTELGTLLGDAGSLDEEAPGSVDIEMIQAEVARRANMGTLERASEVANRELNKDPTAFTSDEELAAQQEASEQAADEATETELNESAEAADVDAVELPEAQGSGDLQPPPLDAAILDQSADILALERQQEELTHGDDQRLPEVAGDTAADGLDNGVGSGTDIQLAAGAGSLGSAGVGSITDSGSGTTGTPDSALVEPDSDNADAITPTVELEQLKQQLAPLIEINNSKGGLTASEGAEYERITARLNKLQFDTAKPATPKQVAPAKKRLSTLLPEVNAIAYNNLIQNYDVYEPLMAAVSGVHFNANTPVDDILLGKNPKVTPEALYAAFNSTREALRAQYGDTITLYRAPGKQRKKPTTNWATTEAFAKQFGDKVISKEFPVEQVIAAVVSPNGRYHELVMGKAPTEKAEEQVPDYATAPAVEGSSVAFEVAPDPNDTALTERWNKLPHLQKVGISGKIATEIVPRALKAVGVKGSVKTQLGGYLDETNPSFVLSAEAGTEPKALVEAAKLTGFVLSQDSMMVVSPEPFEGSEPTGLIKVRFPGNPTPEQVHDIYMKIRRASGGDIMGHSTVGGVMQIAVRADDVDTLYTAVKKALAKEPGRYLTSTTRSAHWAFVSKEDYDNGSDRSGGTAPETGGPAVQRDSLRAEATRLVQEALDANERETTTGVAESEGKASQVATAAFKKWFGGSKVVDEGGKPLVVYHGTHTAFDTFKPSKTGVFGPGMYFADESSNAAAAYGDNIIEAYLSLQNPWEIQVDVEAQSAYDEDFDHPGIDAILSLPNGRQILDSVKATDSEHFGPELQKAIKEKGHDGIIATYPDGSKEYIAFEPNQIKSATGNSGDFDPAKPSIVEEPKGSEYGLTQAEVEALPAAQQKARQTGIDAVKSLRRHSTSVLGSALAKDFKQRGAVSLIGRTIKNTEDLAVAAQVLRDPRFETIRYFFVKGRKIVGQTSISSRLPASSFAAPDGAEPGQYALTLAEEAKRVGATGYYMMHNHPSGDPTPSEADRRLTQYIVGTVGDTLKYHGHVIINHQAYTVLDAQGKGEPLQRKFRKTYDSTKPTKKHALLGSDIRDPLELAHAGKLAAISKDTVIIFGQGNGGIRGIWEVDPTSMSPLRQAATLRRMALSTSSPQLFAYNIPASAVQRATTAIRTGLLTDAIQIDGDKVTSLAQFTPPGNAFGMALGKLVKTKEVAQDLPEYTAGATKPLDKTANSKASSKSKQPTQKAVSGGSPTSAPASASPASSPPAKPPVATAAPTGAGAPPPNPASWNAPQPSKLDDVIYKLQDKHVDTHRVLQSIKTVSEAFNPRLKEELYHGRVATRVNEFLREELRPLLQAMRNVGVSMDDLETFLHNRHAEEANDHIASLDGGMPDGGSGILTADARKYLAGLSKSKRATYDRLAAMVDKIIAKTRQETLAYGLESPSTIKAWTDKYKHYIPLMREDMGGGLGQGQGFSVKGPASKRRTGSNRAVVDVLANIAMQRELTVTRGEKNRVALALYGLALSNPNPSFWEVDNPPKQKEVLPGIKTYEVYYSGSKVYESHNKALAQEYARNANLKHGPKSHTIKTVTGPERVVTSTNPRYKSEPNVVVARLWNPVTGEVEDRTVTFNKHDPRAKRMAEALKNLDADQLGWGIGMFSKGTRWFASVNTQYNPVFGALNLMRDMGGAMLNLTSTPLAKHKARILAESAKVLRGLYVEIRAQRKGQRVNSKYAHEWDEFQSVGGKTGYRDMFRDSGTRNEAIADELKSLSEGKLKGGARAVLNWLTDYNDTAENAVRLAAYMVAKEQGLSKEKAASIAKNLTVNFNRKGQAATQIGALYAFFNASVQGTARIAETLSGPAGKKILAGGVALGVMQQLMLATAGFGDDDPPEFVRERNFIVPLPGSDKGYVAIPYPLGYNALPNIGRIATQWMMNDFEKPTDYAIDLGGVILNAFNPISGGSIGQALTPTVGDPILALESNRDWTGRTIAREDFNPNKPTPGFSRAKDTSTPHANWLAHIFNRLSGGTEYTAGKFSPSPDQIDYLIGQIGGGVLRETNKTVQTISSLATGEDLPTYKVPFFGRFYGTAKGPTHERAKFYANLNTMHEHELELKGRREDGLPVDDYLTEHPEARLVRYASSTSRLVSRLNKRKRELVASSAPKAEVKALEDNITRITSRFNARLAALTDESDEETVE